MEGEWSTQHNKRHHHNTATHARTPHHDIRQHSATSGSTAHHNTTHHDMTEEDRPHYKIIKGTVRNVYDGDTFTLVDERRVRLIGIDAPEVKEQEIGAQEAKALLKSLCHRREVELEIDERSSQDKFGRIVATVYVVDPETGERVCVNDALIQAGVARFYHPIGTSMPRRTHMLTLQSHARRGGLGLWKDFADGTVYITRGGGSYHLRNCEKIATFHLTQRHTSQCLDDGLSACRSCHAK
eukprot:TRINITY_DN804_c0_g1_i1.p1 TRINITY_DN804_c0_g1~~TRINITY_DN804_c0_g1_i1.p1  ORF type:complete len:240 (+),score=47.31 TRINITY_DN804_c0_g1_i1:73-792(+)